MAPIVYKIDPDPDTIITLRNACTDFAPWASITAGHQENVPEDAHDSWDFDVIRKKQKGEEVWKSTSVEAVPLEPGNNGIDIPANQPESNLNNDTMPLDRNLAPMELEPVGIHYYVSSRHLMLASPMFRRALEKDGFSESTRIEPNGLYHISASDWDAEAFLFVMQIIHGRNRQVPRTITLEMFTKIAIIEDYYQFGESLDVFRDIWLENLKRNGVPTTYCREVMLWISVAWTFDAQEQFREATMVATRHSKEAIDSLGLPIPTRVLEGIESKRCETIEIIVSGLHGLLEDYRSSSYICRYDKSLSFQCGSFLLGALTKEMNETGLLDPQPDLPFRGLSIDALYKWLGELRFPIWYSSRKSSAHACGLNENIILLAAEVSAANEGLDLVALKDQSGVLAEAIPNSI